MTRRLCTAALVTLLGLGAGGGAAWATDLVHHRMGIILGAKSHGLLVTTEITLPESMIAGDIEFLLNSALTIEESHPPVEKIPLGDFEAFFGINSSTEVSDQIELARYRLVGAPVDGKLELSYAGSVDFGLSDPREEYTRGLSETAGVLGEEGVYLAGSGFWYPYFDDGLVEFELEIGMPAGWHVISQGNGLSRDQTGLAHWVSGGPMDEIYLVGGPLVVYSEAAGNVEALVYLRQKDDALAAKYLEATAQYVEMYRQLIGPYPYEKFALVENFWETGYGMPSFTLLGPRVIRFPFILHSSYPHEILHNWWGNSVFVDYQTGNWCEGLTAYLADHLIKEQRGQAEEYRRSSLQKYRDYVKEGRDFPLSEFRSRHSAATEAVGYGKTMMGFHMLRRLLGGEVFEQSLTRFYRGFKGKRASFADLQLVLESTSGEELDWFFEQWVERPGAAALEVRVEEVGETGDGFVVTGTLAQTQKGDPLVLDVPIAVQTESGVERSMVRLEGEEAGFAVTTADRPLALQVDPQFDVFRLLDPRETPSSIGQIFGALEILAVLPAAAGEETLDQYRTLMEGWQSDSHSIEMITDDKLERLPADRSVWLLGRDNKIAAKLFADDAAIEVVIEDERLTLGDETVALADHSLVAVRRHPMVDELAIGWLVVEPGAAFPGMGRKLPHYGKYSYLAFEGDEPTNVIKGQWSSSESPLVVDLRPENERMTALATIPLESRQALAELPPVFSEKKLGEHVAYLASTELAGRGVGSAGLQAAADYIAGQFEDIGLDPGGNGGTYFQRFTVAAGPQGVPVETANVIGYLPGSNTGWALQSVIVSAHYDHLGRGWPYVHAGDEGQIHPGADDNASGVAVMLELARNLAAGDRPQRNLVFVAFSGEEAGRAGSKHFVDSPSPFPLEGVGGVINIDTVGRLFDGQVSVLGTATADEWQHIFRGSSFVTGVKSRNVPESAEASDQMSFIEAGIPGVQIFTSAHADYHRPGDTADKVDNAGLVKVATLVKEGVTYMSGREEPLTVKISVANGDQETAAASPGPSSGRRVRFGTIPDFAFQGPGVRIESVAPESPAERAGLQAGDVLVRIEGQELVDLRGYSDVLKTLEPGQTVTATLLRAGEELEISVTVEAR